MIRRSDTTNPSAEKQSWKNSEDAAVPRDAETETGINTEVCTKSSGSLSRATGQLMGQNPKKLPKAHHMPMLKL